MSVERIQERLTQEIFQHTKSPRKASGRSMGTFVEIITYYLLLAWGMRESISIEIALPEYGRQSITHNVEYSLHPLLNTYNLNVDDTMSSITSNIVRVALMQKYNVDVKSMPHTLLTKSGLLRNACLINQVGTDECRYIANLIDKKTIQVAQQLKKPYMIFECKRVGQDAKNNRGPQAIEKAKQGSYVAKSVSSLQKVRDAKGRQMGILYDANNNPTIKPYDDLLQELINTEDIDKIRDFIMTVGVISNHGNWFTSKNQNKEMMVLSQSYDWLIFLTDKGLTEFMEDTIFNEIHILQ